MFKRTELGSQAGQTAEGAGGRRTPEEAAATPSGAGATAGAALTGLQERRVPAASQPPLAEVFPRPHDWSSVLAT